MFAIHALRRIGVAKVAPGSVARQAAAIVPAAHILRDIASEGADVADLRASDHARRIGKQRVALLKHGAVSDLGEGSERPDFDAVGGFAYSAKLVDSTQVDERIGAFRTILEPAVGVLATAY